MAENTNMKKGHIKNPLRKRIIREILAEKGKYIAIFAFIVFMVGLISGVIVAGDSMITAYDEGIEKYNLEDGHFELTEPTAISDLEKLNEVLEEDIAISEQFFYSFTYNFKDNPDYSIHIYKNRDEINTVSIFEGNLPEGDSEIALDRLFADNNDLKIGDTLTIDGKTLEICALIALPDYSCLYEDNSDMMFNARTFSIALVSEKCFEEFSDSKLHYEYAYTFLNDSITDQQAYDSSDKIMEELFKSGYTLTNFLKRQDNKAINFTREDMVGDRGMTIALLYIIIVLLGFIFSLLTNSSIEKEASAIGTLRASGYTRTELIRHYMTAPMLVSLIAMLIGNIMGYTFFKELVALAYYGSYSLTVYETLWSANAFLITTVIPMILLFVIDFLALSWKLKLSPLRFLRHDLSVHKKKRVAKLPNFKFFTRFRLRVILQNIPNYITMTIGIIMANILFMFGYTMLPILDYHTEDIVTHMIANYQYILKQPVETDNEAAEKYAACTLIEENESEVTIYGIQDNSSYLSLTLPTEENEAVISEGLLKKNKLKIGDTITLSEKYGSNSYTFTIVDTYEYPAAMSLFLNLDTYNKLFKMDEDYYTGYFSQEELNDIDDDYIYQVITEKDMTNLSDQLNDSMGSIMPIYKCFSVILYLLIIYLLSKIVLEKNAISISLTKILGYSNGEISRIYLASTAIAVIIALLLSIPISGILIKLIFSAVMVEFGVWVNIYIAPYQYLVMFLTGVISYGLISLLHFRKIKKIPMEAALKNIE